MKAKIHPKWYPEAKITCACGASFTAGSTKPEIQVEICAACHPFFTGEMKYVDTQGRVEKFETKRKKAQKAKYVKKKERKKLKVQAEEEAEKKRPKTLKDLAKK